MEWFPSLRVGRGVASLRRKRQHFTQGLGLARFVNAILKPSGNLVYRRAAISYCRHWSMQLVTLISHGPLSAAVRMRRRVQACDGDEWKVRDTQAEEETRQMRSAVLVYQSHSVPLEYFKSFILEINHIEVLERTPLDQPPPHLPCLSTFPVPTQSPTSFSNISALLFTRLVVMISILCRLTDSRGAGGSHGPNSSRGWEYRSLLLRDLSFVTLVQSVSN
jgi:hypothetical protein